MEIGILLLFRRERLSGITSRVQPSVLGGNFGKLSLVSLRRSLGGIYSVYYSETSMRNALPNGGNHADVFARCDPVPRDNSETERSTAMRMDDK